MSNSHCPYCQKKICPFCGVKPIKYRAGKTCGKKECQDDNKKEWEKRYNQIPEVKNYRKAYQKQYSKSYQKAYRDTDEYRHYNNLRQKEYHKTDSYKKWLINSGMIDYLKHRSEWQKHLPALMIRDKGKCKGCGKTNNLTIDHIIPKKICKDWGWPPEQTHAISNLHLLCRSCNSTKGKKNIAFLKERLNKKNKNLTKTTESGLSYDTRS